MPPRQRYSPIPSTKTALSVDCPVQLTARFRKSTLFQDSHDTCPRTFHARSHFPGRSCLFPGDLPCWRLFSWKVLRFSGGPSMPEPVFLEGPAFFRGTNHPFALTIHQNGSFGGRTWQVRGWFCQGIGRRTCSWSSAENGGRAVIVDNFFSIVDIFCIILYPGKF